MYEVELKVQVSDVELLRIKRYLEGMGALREGSVVQVDDYFDTPDRVLYSRDSALRVRKQDEVVEVTYKGKRVSNKSKTRSELVARVNNARSMEEVLETCGLVKVATVIKRREVYRVRDIKVSLDTVEGLGSFVELEASARDEAGVKLKEEILYLLLEELGLRHRRPILSSYLELILEKRGEHVPSNSG